MRSALQFAISLIIAATFVGCGGPNRYYEREQAVIPKFDAVVIETPYSEIQDRAATALAPYFKVTSRAEARVSGTQDKTLVVEINGSRGFFGSTAKIMLRRFDSVDRDKGRLVFIDEKAGIFWTGVERALVKALRAMDEEAARFSTRVLK